MNQEGLDEELNFWPSFSDMFLVLFVMALAYSGYLYQEKSAVQKERDKAITKETTLRDLFGGASNEEIKKQLEDKDSKIAELEKQVKTKNTEIESLKEQIKQLATNPDLQKFLDDANQEIAEIKKQHKEDLAKKDTEIESLKKQIAQLGNNPDLSKLLDTAKEKIAVLENRLQENLKIKDAEIARLEGDLKRIEEKTRLVKVLIDESKIKFLSGSSTIPPSVDIREIFQPLIDKLEKTTTSFVIEVYGHTDKQSRKKGSNNDLGMARAESVKNAIYDSLSYEQRWRVKFKTYSAGEHTPIEKDTHYYSDCPDCRRIEVMMRPDIAD